MRVFYVLRRKRIDERGPIVHGNGPSLSFVNDASHASYFAKYNQTLFLLIGSLLTLHPTKYYIFDLQ